MRLSRYVQLHPDSIDSSLQRLNCASRGLIEVDINPAVLSLLTSPAPDEVQRVVQEFPGVREAQESDIFDVGSGGMNTALALSLHTVLLSRNRITTTIGIVQFRNVVRLSLLGNRIQRVEDCEGLSVLPSLQYLSLEFNPVASLAHYRAHMLRICSWPESLRSPHCRLRRLDGRPVTPAEIDRASQCLQREKVSMCELVHRMRFLNLLVEAEKRIALHCEMRRRGCVVQDIAACLSVETVVTRCSAQVLALVDTSAAAHMARQLMSGRCRMCAVNESTPSTSTSLALLDETVNAESLSCTTTSGSHVLLRNPHQATLSTFCKDWSRDVFRRAVTTMDLNICTSLLSIAHSLNEELTVMDVDRLNKLWCVQAAKIDAWRLYQPSTARRSKSPNPESVPKPISPGTSHHIPRPLPQELCVVPLSVSANLVSVSPNETPSPTEAPLTPPVPFHHSAARASPENTVESLHSISPISTPPVRRIGDDSAFSNLSISECEHIDPKDNVFVKEHVHPEVHDNMRVRESVMLVTAQRRAQRQCFVRWTHRTRRRRLDALCAHFVQRRLTALLLARPTAHSICATFELLPRAERKRVLLQHWREQARALYGPRALRHAHLFARWRWRTYQSRVVAAFAAGRRRAVLCAVWAQWIAAVNMRASAKCPVGPAGSRGPVMEAGPSLGGLSASSEGSSRLLPTALAQTDSIAVLTTATVQMASVAVQAAPVRVVAVATQAVAEESNTQIADQRARAAAGEEAIAVMHADRNRLVERIVASELRANMEGVRVQECEEEIATLRGQLAAMTLREECMRSAINDYQREIKYLQDVVRALREERREMLCPIIQ